MTATLWLAGLLIVLGAVFGSFIATIAIRWPQGRSVTKGRSRCDACDRPIAARDLIPIVSYFVRRGACRSCGAPIARSHLVIELLGAAIGGIAAISTPGGAGIAGAVFGWLLLALAAIDQAALWLPDPLVATLALAGVGTAMLGVPPGLIDRTIGGVAGFAVLAAVAAGYHALRGRVGLGGGDPKLFGAIGLWLGWRALPLTLLLACLIGFVALLAVRAGGRRVRGSDQLPFGALLAAAAFPIWWWQAAGG